MPLDALMIASTGVAEARTRDMSPFSVRVLAGDIGGTHARLALVEVRGTQARVLQEQQFHSRDFTGLGALVQRFQATLLV